MADDVSVLPDGSESSRGSTPNVQPQTWLRRLSSSITRSRDSSIAPRSRPASAVISHSNGSLAFSHSGSTTPMLPSIASTSQPRNKLVKRSSSLRAGNPPQLSSGSKLPVPTFKRPATSHQRSATLQEHPSPVMFDSPLFNGDVSRDARDHQWRHYFTPKVALPDVVPSRRRTVSGIPNPIKRIYPDRRYTPVLVSAQQHIRQGDVEADDEPSLLHGVGEPTRPATMPSSVAPSPLVSQNEAAPLSRRSFSFSNHFMAEPSPLLQGSTFGASRTTTGNRSRGNTTGRQRVSAAQSSMGAGLSSSRKTSERPSKRRNVSDSEPLSHATHGINVNPSKEIQLNLGSADQSPSSWNTDVFHNTSSSNETEHGPTPKRRVPSATFASNTNRPARLSTATSEITSAYGSDSENRSLDDVSTDYQSDAFDSFPTRTTTTTRSSSGKRGPPIETIFDESPPTFSSGRSTKLRDLLSASSFPSSDSADPYRYSTIEEEDSIATPRRSLADKSLTSSPSARNGSHNAFALSPPIVREMPDPDDIDWDAEDEPGFASSPPETERRVSRSPDFPTYRIETSLPLRLAVPGRQQNPNSTASTPRRSGVGQDRATIFDWAEIQPSPSHNNSPPRPKTVHGKKDPESRGSRPPGRRLPSGMHARSHSVPVVPDVDGKRISTVATKFGTWGVGSKGVTEDWNEDFDFDDSLAELPSAIMEDRRIDSGHAMFIPKSIQEQQDNVVANISLLREWGLLIEELKDLRMRAAGLGMLAGRHAEAWSEVDAMIDLADQESHENTLEPRYSPPSSPGFDDTAFDEPMREAVESARARARSIRSPQPPMLGDEDSIAVFDEPQTPSRSVTTRPRKDSEAVARSVIEALQNRRTVSDPTSLQAQKPVKKVPFDTATLRHIVPYVNGVKRKIKEVLREAEGLYTSPCQQIPHDDDSDDDDFEFSDNEPSFHSIFTDPRSDKAPTTPSKRPVRRTIAITDNDESEEGGVFGSFG